MNDRLAGRELRPGSVGRNPVRYRSDIGTACPQTHGGRKHFPRLDDAGSIPIARQAWKVDYLHRRRAVGQTTETGGEIMRIRKLRCSFCRKTEDQISKLVAGPRLIVYSRIYICNECVAAASSIIEGNLPPTSAVPRSLLRKVKERWRHCLQSMSRAVPTQA